MKTLNFIGEIKYKIDKTLKSFLVLDFFYNVAQEMNIDETKSKNGSA